MNNDQLETCLRSLKSSSCEPDKIDGDLEERMMNLCVSTRTKRRRMNQLAAIAAVLLISGTGFVALGGDTAVMNYISPSTEKDEEGNTIPHDFSVGKWMHSLHDHLWEHFRRHHVGH
jgi:hypothetical protein